VYPGEIGDGWSGQHHRKGGSTSAASQPVRQGLAKLLIPQGRIEPATYEDSARPAELQCLWNSILPGILVSTVQDAKPVGQTAAIQLARDQRDLLARPWSARQKHVNARGAHAFTASELQLRGSVTV
jgi:hypothetical protein